VKFFLGFLFPGKNPDPLLVPKLSLGTQLGQKLCFGNLIDTLRNHICETTCLWWQPHMSRWLSPEALKGARS